jgi:hypothetical protein
MWKNQESVDYVSEQLAGLLSALSNAIFSKCKKKTIPVTSRGGP